MLRRHCFVESKLDLTTGLLVVSLPYPSNGATNLTGLSKMSTVSGRTNMLSTRPEPAIHQLMSPEWTSANLIAALQVNVKVI
jgi:hypothetical protein